MEPQQELSDDEIYLRLPDVLRIAPMSKAAWYAGVKSKPDWPQPVKLSDRIVCWRKADVLAFMQSRARDTQQQSAE
jgi:prophage regulatory protein